MDFAALKTMGFEITAWNAGAVALVGGALGWWRVSIRRSRAAAQRAALASAHQREIDTQRELQAAHVRNQTLSRNLFEIPECAEALAAARDACEVRERTLDLVQTLFAPQHSAFFRVRDESLTAVTLRGESPLELGHSASPEHTVVAWVSETGLPLAFDEVEGAMKVVGGEGTGEADLEFSICAPVVQGEDTVGVILVGPLPQAAPHLRTLMRTLSLLTAVALRNLEVLQHERLLARTDQLTGLLNKAEILSQLDQMVAGREATEQGAVFLFDLDHFKYYNDSQGHPAGDTLLRTLGSLLRRHCREGQLLGRYGGEEFLLLMPGIRTETEALAGAEHLRALIAEFPYPQGEHQPLGRVTISGGVARWPAHSRRADELLFFADEALYHAKAAGRDRVHVYQEQWLGLVDPDAPKDPEKT